MSTLHEKTKTEYDKKKKKSTITAGVTMCVCVLPPPKQTEQHWPRLSGKALSSTQKGHKQSARNKNKKKLKKEKLHKTVSYKYQ